MPTLLCGRYRLVSRIGGGGMGEVWKAYDEHLEREVAVKVIHAHLAGNETTRARLMGEARLAGAVHHPGIVEVFDYDEHEEDGRTIPFVVMSLVDGSPLSDVLTTHGPLTPGETMAIVADLADALAAAHARGIVHRDIKPGNVLLARGGRVKLVDFGIARTADSAPLTTTGQVLGTVDYLSPEQAAGRPATAASDLYALGVVAYTCLVGAPPYQRETDIATALAHIQHPLPALPAHVPPGVARLVESLLAKAPADRPGSATDVSHTARALARRVPDLATPVDEGPQVQATLVHPAITEQSAPIRRGRFPRRVAAIGAVAVVLALAFSAMRGSTEVTVPDLRGETNVEAAAKLAHLGLTMKERNVDLAGHDADEVVRQTPTAGSMVEKHGVVTIDVASGDIPLPGDLVGMTVDEATARLRLLGLEVSTVERTSSEPAGTVIAVDPDQRAAPGDTVELTVALGPTPEPDVTPSKKHGGKGRR